MGTPDIVCLIAVELGVKDLSSLCGVCLCYSGIARQELRFRVYNVLKMYISSWTAPLKWQKSAQCRKLDCTPRGSYRPPHVRQAEALKTRPRSGHAVDRAIDVRCGVHEDNFGALDVRE